MGMCASYELFVHLPQWPPPPAYSKQAEGSDFHTFMARVPLLDQNLCALNLNNTCLDKVLRAWEIYTHQPPGVAISQEEIPQALITNHLSLHPIIHVWYTEILEVLFSGRHLLRNVSRKRKYEILHALIYFL